MPGTCFGGCPNRLAVPRRSFFDKSLKQVFDTTGIDHTHLVDSYSFKDGIYYHTAVLKAIIEKDAKAAKKRIIEHLEQAISLMP